MKVFVTGVAGQLGHDIMNDLAARGYEGIGTDIASEYNGISDGTAVTRMPYVSLDITDRTAVEQGHAIRATGCNPQMARAQGINTSFCKVLALMISNGLVGLSGALYAQYQGAADVNMGRGAIVIGLAAVIIGDVLFGKLCAGKKLAFAYTLFSVIVGAIIYYLVLSIILWLKFPSDDLKLFSAIVVAIFLAIPYLKNKKKATRGL